MSIKAIRLMPLLVHPLADQQPNDKNQGGESASSLLSKMPLAKFSVVNFDFAEVMGRTCTKVVMRMSKINFHDAAPEAPPGHSVDFGHDDCKHDDKCCECLPSARHAAEVTEESHRLAMVWFSFCLLPV
jgi:hypothetical protein